MAGPPLNFSNIPELPDFSGDGRTGIPVEFDLLLERVAAELRAPGGGARWPGYYSSASAARALQGVMANGFGIESVDAGFQDDAVCMLAECYRAELLDEREQLKSAKDHGQTPRPSHRIATLAYCLHAYCATHGRPAPAPLLWLTFEVLGLREGWPAPEVQRDLNLAEGVTDLRLFGKAVILDAQADAEGHALPLKELERRTGVSRRTLKRWRAMPQYQFQREAIASGLLDP